MRTPRILTALRILLERLLGDETAMVGKEFGPESQEMLEGLNHQVQDVWQPNIRKKTAW